MDGCKILQQNIRISLFHGQKKYKIQRTRADLTLCVDLVRKVGAVLFIPSCFSSSLFLLNFKLTLTGIVVFGYLTLIHNNSNPLIMMINTTPSVCLGLVNYRHSNKWLINFKDNYGGALSLDW